MSIPTSATSNPTQKTKKVKSKTPIANAVPSDPNTLAPALDSAPTTNPTNDGSALKGDGGDRQRGPVEEVIARRMRQLGKKLQRYRSYASQSAESLNSDQKAALGSLPSLEGAYRELEDLIKEKGPVDEQELIQAAKLREAKESAAQGVDATVSARIAEYQDNLIKPLGMFLQLYTLLHPARSSDHENLTFSQLDLPARLQDEVQATDVLRVGRMYEDLIAGGDAAKAVLSGLVSGAKGDDEEDEHVHHLLQLLGQPKSETVLEEEPQPVPDTNGPSEDIQVDSVPLSREVSISDLPNGHQDENDTSNGEIATGALNFLQDDELVDGPEGTGVNDDSGHGLGGEPGDEEYEMVPHLEAHQTSGSQPPIVEDVSESPTMADESKPTSAPAPAAAAFAEEPTRNWADLDEEDDLPVHNRQAPSADTAVAAPAISRSPSTNTRETPAEAIGKAEDAKTATEAEGVVASAQVPSATTSVTTGAPTGPAKAQPQPQSQPRNHNQNQQHQQDPRQNQGQTRKPNYQNTRVPLPPKPKEGSMVVDEDGFISKVRRSGSGVVQGGENRGRGGGGGGGGRGRGGGRGNGEYRGGGGRGGNRGRGGMPVSSNGGPGQGQGGQGRGLAQGQSQGQPPRGPRSDSQGGKPTPSVPSNAPAS